MRHASPGPAWFRAFAARFAADVAASISLALALVFIVLVLFVGVAVDGTRAFYTKDVLQKSLDAAGLAAGHALNPDDVESDAIAFFDANMASLTGVATSDGPPTIVVSDDGGTISLSATATMETTFMRLANFRTIQVAAFTEIVRKTTGIELALVMDTTMSMDADDAGGGETRIDAMKAAGQDLVDIIFGDEEVHPNLWVSVVPFVATVNVGNRHTDWLDATSQTRVDRTSPAFRYGDPINMAHQWKGCVRARYYPGGLATDNHDDDDTTPVATDAYPVGKPFTAFWYDDDDYVSGSRRINDWKSTTMTGQTCGWNGWQWACSGGTATETFNTPFREEATAGNDAFGPNLACGQPIQELTPNKQTVLDAFDNMHPTRWGGTAVSLGAVWGWRTISPMWRGLWGGEATVDQPADYRHRSVQKAMVLLTDGAHNWLDFSGTDGQSHNRTSYGLRRDFFSSDNNAHSFLDARLSSICTAMKANDIKIYTISFGASITTSIANLMRNCATDPAWAFNATTGADLRAAFSVIGNQLQKLRISK